MHQVLYRWEQDGAGGDHGTATFFPNTPHEVNVVLQTFEDGHKLFQAISTHEREVHTKGRMQLLSEISRIRP